MKVLCQLLKPALNNVEIFQIKGSIDIPVGNIQFDSRKIGKNDLFAAIPGINVDGHDYIEQAVEKGARSILCEKLPENINQNVTYLHVENTAETLAWIAKEYYNNPSTKLKLIGITGTNGKTTTATILYHLFKELGFRTGLISTVAVYIDEEKLETTHTTPDIIKTNELLDEMSAQDCQYCFMEVSSHAVVQHRVTGLNFVGGIFSNITHEHLDYHKNFDNYLKAKKTFFDQLPPSAFALYNTDDKNGKIMVQNTKANKYSYGQKSFANFTAHIIENHFEGMQLEIDGIETWTPLVGAFNAYNFLAAYASAILLGQKREQILTVLSHQKAVRGRFETIHSKNGITGIVDYAHTPDALEKVLLTINEIRNPGQNLISVIGAGGDRDPSKRPIMAKVSADNSNRVILTSDNPRSESPEKIIEQMLQGVKGENTAKVISITNRREAIKTACMLAKKGDIILIAGKGHETYQEVKGKRSHFDDREELGNSFNNLNK